MSLILETVAIGDELLTGKTSDTNSTFVAESLFGLGLRLERVTVVPDTLPAIREALESAAARADRVIVFGGLGPTSDDKTAEAVAEWTGSTLARHPESEARLREYYARRNRPLTPQSLKQVLYPSASTAMTNPRGMAPGFKVDRGKCRLYFLPGVPSEMKAIFEQSILPELRALGSQVRSHSWRCLGIAESDLQIAMDPIEAALPVGAWLGYRTRHPENHLMLYCRPEAHAQFESFVERIGAIVAPFSYTEKDLELEEIVGETLRARGLTLALAESCTAGLVTHRLTRVPGSSDYVWGGYAVYQIAAKAKMLGVELSDPSDAVSKECTRRLAVATRRESGASMAAAITGYMGPTGGTESDPIGTVYLCVDDGRQMRERRVQIFARSRLEMQWAAATYLLDWIRQSLSA